MSAVISATFAVIIIVYYSSAQTLQWDDAQHSSFSLYIDHNASVTAILNQFTYNSETYEFLDPVVINSTGGLSMTIEAFMSFNMPIDDITQASSASTAHYRYQIYDYQTVTSQKIESLLYLVHNGTLQFVDTESVNKHLFNDGTLEEVKFKHYPITLSCPQACENPDESAFAYTYGGSSCDEDCIVYDCEYNGLHWGAGSCDPLAIDDNVTAIESQHEAWGAAITTGNAASWLVTIAWGYVDPSSDTTISDTADRWMLQYAMVGTTNTEDLEKTCDSETVYWDNGYFENHNEYYSPTAAVGNEFRKVSYSLKNISVSVPPQSIPITIGSYSGSVSATIADTIKQAISDKLSGQQIVMDDIGHHWNKNGALSNSSTWLFINDSYFGYGCNQINVDQWVWYQGSCGECMNHVLSTWSTSQYGITTLPYYDHLDSANGIEDAVAVTNNLTKFSTSDVIINFKYSYPTTSITISSTNFEFKQPNLCNAVSKVEILASTKSTNVSFTNCGTASADFTYTINCANSWSTTTSSINVAANTAREEWTSAVANANCDTVSSITVSTSPCLEFWNSTCSWTTTLTTITAGPTLSPTLQPTDFPTPQPSVAPSPAPTAAPVSFFDSCTTYQVVPVRGAVDNTIEHQELCLPSQEGHYIIDINAQKSYYVAKDSRRVTNTTINKINVEDYDTGADSNEAATGSALIGHSIIYIETWFDVLAYLGLDLSDYLSSESSTSVMTSIKIDGLDISNDIPSSSAQAIFITTLQNQIISELACDNNQITVNSLRDGSIAADLEITSTSSNAKSSLEVSVDLQNYIASKTTTSASVSSPLNTVNNYYYANETNDIVFTNCPYRITATTYEGETVTVSWTTPSINARVNDNSIVVYQAIGESSGESFAAGSYFIRYVALSSSNSSITPKYCSFVIVVEEEEWVIEFMGIEFSVTSLIIIATVIFFICTGSIAYSCIMRGRGRNSCCHVREGGSGLRRVQSEAPDADNDYSQKPTKGQNLSNGFKSVIVSSHNTSNAINSPQLNIARASAPVFS